MGLGVCLLLFVLLYYAATTAKSSILTKPRISEEQAANIVEEQLRGYYIDFKGYSIYVGGEGYKPYPEFKARGEHLPLTFTSDNGTFFYVNNTTYEIYDSCVAEAFACRFSANYANESIGRLTYAFDLDVGSYCGGPEIVIVDAIDGKVLFSFASERPEAISKACLLKNSA